MTNFRNIFQNFTIYAPKIQKFLSGFREHHSFLKLCLKLLSNHLALALAGGVATSILGRQAGPLRNLLFRLMDSTVPDEIQEVRIENNSSHIFS